MTTSLLDRGNGQYKEVGVLFFCVATMGLSWKKLGDRRTARLARYFI
jgi:hypothetical protein